MQENNQKRLFGERAEGPQPVGIPGILCLTPAMNEALNKMKSWMSGLIPKRERLASSEVQSKGTDQFQPLFQNDYAPPVVKQEIATMPIPSALRVSLTDKPDVLQLSWEPMPGRHLYLVQINTEDPGEASDWTTNSVSTQPNVEIQFVFTDRPFWIRVCTVGPEGRSGWAVLKGQS